MMDAPVIMVDEFQRWGGPAPRPFHYGSSHLTVDGESDEHLAALHAFALRIGLRRSWFQDKNVPHYDVTESMRRRALVAGAIFVSAADQARARIDRRSN
jgi:hypothetical protein